MGRLFILLLFVTVLLICAVGESVYWISSVTVNNTKEDAARKVAKAIALNVSEQLFLLNKTLDRIAREPAVIAAVTSENPALMASVAEDIKKYFPETLKIRLLLPSVNKVDESAVPHLGFADLDMVRETLAKNQSPMVQGDMGANRHLAMTSQIIHNNRVVGVILASLDQDFIAKTVKAVELDNEYVALKQDKSILGSSGEPLETDQKHSNELTVPRTTWVLQYEYPTGAGLGQMSKLWLCIAAAVALIIAAFFLGYRKLSKLIKDDIGSILKAFKDIMAHRSMGSYPVNLAEMNIVISSFIRLNRAMDDSGGNIKEEDDEEDSLEKSGFFSEPDNFGFTEMPLDEPLINHEDYEHHLSIEPITKTKQTPESVGDKADIRAPLEIPLKAVIIPNPMSMPEPVQLPVTTTKNTALSGIFKAYDIRGIVGTTLTMNTVYDIGRAFGTTAKSHDCQAVMLGRDGRTSSPALAEELAKGIASTGCNVIDIGMVPTPVLYFAAHHIEGRTGIMVTGSHNPPDYNGFKMVVDGETLAEERIQDLRRCIESRSYATGDMGLIEKNTKLTTEYVGTIAEDIRIARPMLIVLDCGNGVGGKLGPILLRTLGCEVIELHCEVDGTFPHHHPDPSKPENMVELSAAVKHYKADLGIAFDGDADRIGVVDSNGKIIWPDRQMMLYAKNVLAQKVGAEIIYDVKCSKHLAEQIKKFGGRSVMWKSGHSLMKAKIKETGAKLAGEMSGHIFFNDRWFGFDDALYAAARLIEILSNEPRSSAQVFASFPDSINTPELNIDLKEGENVVFIEKMIAAADFVDAKIIDIDGMRVEFADGWGLIRASNTTPSLTLRFEADTQEAMQTIQQRFRQLINKVNSDIHIPF